jgi:uncharacterized protein (TIGR03437 family)
MPKSPVVALLTFFASVAAAQTAGNWTQQFPSSPSARVSHAMAYDSAHSQVVLFGGIYKSITTVGAAPTPGNDTWTWDGSNWTQQSPANSPDARYDHAMTYDPSYGIVLYGGYNEFNVFLHDLWIWNGSAWTNVTPAVGPPARSSPAIAYDSAHRQVVLFGGQSATSLLNDTWLWNGFNWTQASPKTSPPGRASHSMAYDSAHGQVVLFGGTSGLGSYNDTWLWDGSNWTQASPQTSPDGAQQSAMAFDSVHGQTVLFGGEPGDEGQTWLWDGSNWTLASPKTSPPPRFAEAMAYDSGHDQVVMFGGNVAGTPGADSDTWTWYGGALAPPGPSISTAVSASAFGGFSSVAPGSWVEIYGANLAPDTQGWTGADFTNNNAPTTLNGVSVMIGGQAAFVDYVSATQVNAQLPSNIAPGGMLPLTVTNANGTSAAVNLTVNTTAPGLLAPASFKVGTNQYLVAQHADGSYVLPVGAISGVNSHPAQPGETVVTYGVGFGPVTPDIPAGQIVTQVNSISAPLQILFGQARAELPYSGLAPTFVGLYQFNLTVPTVANSDLVPVTFTLGGVAGTQTLFTSVQQ